MKINHNDQLKRCLAPWDRVGGRKLFPLSLSPSGKGRENAYTGMDFNRRTYLFAGCALIVACAFIAACAQPASTSDSTSDSTALYDTLTAAEGAEGWISLFDGVTLDQWRGFGQDSVPPGWTPEYGVIHFQPEQGGGNLMTKEQYDDFVLQIDWRISDGGNSGIFYRVSEDTARAWMTGPEMQVLDNEGHPNGQNPLTRAGALYGLIPPSEDATRPAGEWNHVRIVVDDARVEHWLNDVKVVQYTFGSDAWNERIAGSKFEEMRWYGHNKKGHIVLQDHGDEVWYRNIRIKPLNDSSASSYYEHSDDWRFLLDGEDLNRWRGYQQSDVPEGWSAEDKILYFNPYADGGGNLVSKDQYDDFILELDWKISIWGNSGILYRVSENADEAWQTGPEMQILDDTNHPYAGDSLLDYSSGAVAGLYAPAQRVVHPAGEWNRARIVARGPHVEHWLNGERIVSYEIGSEDWRRRVADSMFDDAAGFGANEEGHIVLQDHGGEVWFRNIRIRSLENDRPTVVGALSPLRLTRLKPLHRAH